VAHALDLVGERWTLLIVRELLFGAKRFRDLRAGLPALSPNVLTQRLRGLEEIGVVRHYWLGPPAGVQVYELTERGARLEPVLTELGSWGLRSPSFDPSVPTSVNALMLAVRTQFSLPPETWFTAVVALRFGEDAFTAAIEGARAEISRGVPAAPDVLADTDTGTFTTLMTRTLSVRDAVAAGRLVLTGDTAAFTGLLAGLSGIRPAESRLRYRASRPGERHAHPGERSASHPAVRAH
jgi:DNA-binding HxlR family transcriptional regulator